MAILKMGILGLAALTVAGCVGDTPPNPISAPDLNRITVFFPLDGLVNGRGGPGEAPAGYGFVYVKPHPSRNVVSFARVNADGSFNFRIAAGGGDLLEIAYAKDPKKPEDRGAPTFVEVPLPPPRPEEFSCCRAPQASRGRCQPTREMVCSNAITLPECTSDGDCAYLSGDHIQIQREDFSVTPPGADGRVKVRSNDPDYKLHLIRFENRGQRGIGGVDPRFRDYAIADEKGVAELTFAAKGDDEIVVRVFALDGYVRSREHAMYVPDSPLVELDVVGVIPLEGLRKGARGKVGIRLAPKGLDQRGICPPSRDPSLGLCFSGGKENASGVNVNFHGGLDYDMLTFDRFTIDGQPVTPQEPRNAMGPTKFTDGNVLAPPVSLVLIVDHSAGASDDSIDGNASRFRAAENFLRSMRKRDNVAVLATGSHSGGVRAGTGYTVRYELGAAPAAIGALEALERLPPDGDHDVNSAIAEAGRMLAEAGKANEGRIVVLSANQPIDGGFPFLDALDFVIQDEEDGRSAYPVFIVARRIDLSQPAGGTIRNNLDTFAGFTGGSFAEINDATDFLTRTAEVTGLVSGAFVLAYEVEIPEQAGAKTARVELGVTLTLPNTEPMSMMNTVSANATFEGDIELRDNPAN